MESFNSTTSLKAAAISPSSPTKSAGSLTEKSPRLSDLSAFNMSCRCRGSNSDSVAAIERLDAVTANLPRAF
jgi:hypothetical protein